MPRFQKAEKQAASVIKVVQGKEIKSVGTARNYEQALTRVSQYLKDQRTGISLRQLTPEQAEHYLRLVASQYTQNTLDLHRKAIQCMMRHVTGQLEKKDTLECIQTEKPEKPLAEKSRAYTAQQVEVIASHQREANALATRLAYSAGLRAHELLTLRVAGEQPQTPHRQCSPQKFSGREGIRYTTKGKGGLIREVLIPTHLAKQLEARKLERPRTVTDRGIKYQQHYDIAGGRNWTSSFSYASKAALGWSRGAHGLRHAYAQTRLSEAQRIAPRIEAQKIVSQELGHFRPEITETYLR